MNVWSSIQQEKFLGTVFWHNKIISHASKFLSSPKTITNAVDVLKAA